MTTTEAPAQPVDDATAAYIFESRKCFEDLKQVASQIAGLLVLAAAGSKNALPEHPMLDAATRLFREADDALRRARPTRRAQPHHWHLMNAAGSIGQSLNAANRNLRPQSGGLEIDPILIPLRAGYAELERASQALPGFEMVAYERACCAQVHGGQAL